MLKCNFLNLWFVDCYKNLYDGLTLMNSLYLKVFKNLSVHGFFCFFFLWRMDTINDSVNSNIWSVKESHLLNLKSSSLRDGLLGRGNYHLKLSLGPGVNPLNFEVTFVDFPNIPRGFRGRGCNWLVHKYSKRKNCKGWLSAHPHTAVKPLKTFYILLQWRELFQGFYT